MLQSFKAIAMALVLVSLRPAFGAQTAQFEVDALTPPHGQSTESRRIGREHGINDAQSEAQGMSISPGEFYQRAQEHPAKPVSALMLRTWLDEKSVVLLDLRSPESYARGHLQGALNLPATELTETALKHLVPNIQSRIAVYCDDTLYPTRRIALTTLGYPAIQQLGYAQVYLLEELWRSRECQASNTRLAETTPEAQLAAGVFRARQLCGELLPIVSDDAAD
jgi:hypothetical protein